MNNKTTNTPISKKQMKIRIIEVLSLENTLRVTFLSPAGRGTAEWFCIKPTVGDELDVEFDLDEVFLLGKNLMSSCRKSPFIDIINGVTHITAEITKNTEEEWIALKLEDSLFVIELDEPLTQKTGFIEIIASKIHMHPTNI